MEELLDQLLVTLANNEQITLLLGSGVTTPSIPRLAGVVALADQYAASRSDDGALASALHQARDAVGGETARPNDVYAAYQRVFQEWVSGDEFDVVAQQAVLEAYRPPDPFASPLAAHGVWQRVDHSLGERLEMDVESWAVPVGLRALGAILARLGKQFGNHVLTSNVDPLIEVAVRSGQGRAVSVPALGSWPTDADVPAEGAIRVLHLHGFWRPVEPAARSSLAAPGSGDPRRIPALADLVTGDAACVVGCGDHDGSIRAMLDRVATSRPIRVLWAEHRGLPSGERNTRRGGGLYTVRQFLGIDASELFRTLAHRLGVPWQERAAGPRQRHRQYAWERSLVSVLETRPPSDVGGLLRRVEQRFGWRFVSAGHLEEPELVFWPVRVRRRASLINMVQALVAGALAARGAQVVVSLDDFGVLEPEVTARFRQDIARWIRRTAPAAVAEYVSLVDELDSLADVNEPAEYLLRPTDPWQVAKEFYGKQNSSVYSKLAAVKAIPNIALHDLEDHAVTIVRALMSNNANRLLTPLTIWSHLHRILLMRPASAVVTLGGRDEQLFWQQWHETFGANVSQLYNPHIKNLSNRSGLLQWTSELDAREQIHVCRELPGWDDESSLIPWLVDNAFLLPAYLADEPPLKVDGQPVESWPSFLAAADADPGLWDVLVHRVSDLYLDDDVPAE
jgi:hypothetical protein